MLRRPKSVVVAVACSESEPILRLTSLWAAWLAEAFRQTSNGKHRRSCKCMLLLLMSSFLFSSSVSSLNRFPTAADVGQTCC